MQPTLEKASINRRRVMTIWIVGLTFVAGTAIAVYKFFPYPQPTSTISTTPAIKAITALGRLEPKNEMIQLAASNPNGRVKQLFVKVGDRVKAGQVIAVLDVRDRAQAALEQAKSKVEVAKSQLAQVKAGAKQGEIDAQKAVVARTQAQLQEDVAAKDAAISELEAEVQNAQIEYRRYASLEQEGAVSTSLQDSKRLKLDTVQQQLNEAKANRREAAGTLAKQVKEAEATLNEITEVRPVDVQAAQAEVKSAIATVQQAQADLDLTSVYASRDGQILKIYTWEGEFVDSKKGIASLGQTSEMYAVAEVYETDIPKIQKHQTATITSVTGGTLPTELQGVVDEVGLEVAKKDVLNTDPAAEIDARVVEVKVRLNPDDSRKVAGLTNMKVKVSINL